MTHYLTDHCGGLLYTNYDEYSYLTLWIRLHEQVSHQGCYKDNYDNR